MTKREIEFRRGEYADTDDGVKVLVKTVVGKLPEPQRRKYKQLEWQENCLQKEADLLQEGVDAGLLNEWLNNNVSQTREGRQPSVVYKLLLAIQTILLDVGVELLNVALAKNLNTGRPQTCTIGYLKAILKNELAALRQAQGADLPQAQGADLRQAPLRQAQGADLRQAPLRQAQGAASRQEPGAAQAWERMLQYLKGRINAQSFNMWLRPCVMRQCSKVQGLTLQVPTEEHKYWLKTHYTFVLSEAFKSVYRRVPAHLVFEVAEGVE